MFVPGAHGDTAPVVDGETSSLDNDPPHERTEMQEDSGVFETDAINVIYEAPVDTHGRGGRRVRGAGGRRVKKPYVDRDDIGSYGIYVGNWSGRRKEKLVNDHIAADLVARNPAQILLAQEVDSQFVETLLDPWNSRACQSRPMEVDGQDSPAAAGKGANYADREVNFEPWHVAVDPQDDAGVIVAARSSRAKSSTVVEIDRMFHREYKASRGRTHLAYSRLLVAQVEWWKPMHGQDAVQILNVHFHHLAAKKDKFGSRNKT